MGALVEGVGRSASVGGQAHEVDEHRLELVGGQQPARLSGLVVGAHAVAVIAGVEDALEQLGELAEVLGLEQSLIGGQ